MYGQGGEVRFPLAVFEQAARGHTFAPLVAPLGFKTKASTVAMCSRGSGRVAHQPRGSWDARVEHVCN